MSTSPESESNKPEFELDMDLHFLPAWAQKAPDTKRYSKYKGDEETSSGRGRSGDRPRGPRRDGPPSRGPRPDGRGPGGPGGGGGRPGFGGGGGRPSFGGDRRGGPPGRGQGQGRDMRDDRPR